MTIIIDKRKIIQIFERNLIVKNGRLFNTDTNKFEGLDGDKVTFYMLDQFGHKRWISGIVDGYTCDRRIKLRGVKELYAAYNGAEKTIDHVSSISDSDYKEVSKVKSVERKTKVEEDWELVLA